MYMVVWDALADEIYELVPEVESELPQEQFCEDLPTSADLKNPEEEGKPRFNHKSQFYKL